MYDANGTETTSFANSTHTVYTIKLMKLITGVTTTSIRAIKTTTKATITVDLPADV